MPGFMHAIKSHLPQSPFSPPKKGGPVITTPEVMTPAMEVPQVIEEQSTSEVLPGEALLQPNSSTVALTLTPANGESSQQLSVDEVESTPLTHQSDSQPEVESTHLETVIPVEPTEGESVQTDSAESITPEISVPAVSEPEASALETAVVESTPVSEADSAVAPEPINVEVEAVQPPVEAVETTEQVAQDAAAPVDEATASNETGNDASPPADSTKPCAKGGKEGLKGHMKRSKSKKTKSDVPETLELGETAPSKPRKSNPLAGKFRSVIEQVRSKVKKDKEVQANKSEPLTPPVVQVIEPAPICEEIVAAA